MQIERTKDPIIVILCQSLILFCVRFAVHHDDSYTYVITSVRIKMLFFEPKNAIFYANIFLKNVAFDPQNVVLQKLKRGISDSFLSCNQPEFKNRQIYSEFCLL